MNKMNTGILMIALTMVLLANHCAREKQSKNQVMMQSEIDSLKSEILVLQIDNGRYNYVIEQLDSTCKYRFDSILMKSE
jgi:hypothetical protein